MQTCNAFSHQSYEQKIKTTTIKKYAQCIVIRKTEVGFKAGCVCVLSAGMQLLDENTMERLMEEFERCCYDNMSHAMETEEGLGIEYDEDVVCDVCQSPDGEDGNEMVFCDKCNICVHQVCVERERLTGETLKDLIESLIKSS